MKKHIIWITAALLSLGALSGCGNSGMSDTAAYLSEIKAEKYVTLGEYTGLTVNVAAPEVLPESVDAYVESIVLQYPMSVAVEGPAEAGDAIVIDFVGKKDGVAFDDGTAEGYSYTLGSYQFIADLDEGMVGMSAGETRDIPVTFPEDYGSADLAGQPAVFTVTVQSIERTAETTELNDEYIVWLTESQYSSVEEFRAYIEDSMWSDAQSSYQNDVLNALADAVLANATFKAVPAGVVKRINETLTSSFTYYASMNGLDLTTYLMYMGLLGADGDAEAVLAEQAELSTKRYVAYQAIADAEGITISDEDVETGILWQAMSAGVTIEEYQAGIDMKGYREYLMLEKVATFLTENNTIEN
ncbi:MAG: trigger factor [Lachnospiraceae bacterium]|jgi:trigger factor|nr:trigger factor [Lachnospiraceae bacterium]